MLLKANPYLLCCLLVSMLNSVPKPTQGRLTVFISGTRIRGLENHTIAHCLFVALKHELSSIQVSSECLEHDCILTWVAPKRSSFPKGDSLPQVHVRHAGGSVFRGHGSPDEAAPFYIARVFNLTQRFIGGVSMGGNRCKADQILAHLKVRILQTAFEPPRKNSKPIPTPGMQSPPKKEGRRLKRVIWACRFSRIPCCRGS